MWWHFAKMCKICLCRYLNPQLNINRVYELSLPSSSSFLISLIGWERETANKKNWCGKLQKIFPWLPEEEELVGNVEFIRNIWTPRQKISVKEQFSSFYWLYQVQYSPDQQQTWEFHKTWCALSDYVGLVLTPTQSPTLRKLVIEKSVHKIKEPLQEFG